MTEIYDKLADLLVNRFEVDPAVVRPDATFDELDMDSLFLVELLLIMESELSVKIRDDSAAMGDTLARAAEAIGEQVAAARSSA